MQPPSLPDQKPDATEPKLKIYFLPNLLTGGDYSQIKLALYFILGAFIFDLLDGRVARMGGVESPFGREFDSLADLISFGAAPAFLVHRVVLKDVFIEHPEWGWFIASIYLICGAFRLARFNCLAAQCGTGGVPDLAHSAAQRKRPAAGQLEIPAGGRACFSLGHDGEHGQISHVQN